MKAFSYFKYSFHRIYFWLVCLAGSGYWGLQANAAEWNLQPRLTLSGTYTDNVGLGGIGAGFGGGVVGSGGDFVSEINPGLGIRGEGRRFNTNINYTLNNLVFAKSERVLMRHWLNANGTAEIVKERFFVDGRAAISQQNAFLFGPPAFDNTNLTGNLRDIRTWSISPYARHRFKNLASGELRYARSAISSNAQQFFNNTIDSVNLSLNSGSAFRTLGWGANYNHTRIDRERSGFNIGTLELERSAGTLRYVITPQFSLIGTGGYERNSFISIRGKSSSHFWTAGFSWVPTTRTNVNASAGQRFFGNTYAASIDHRTRRTIWNLSYLEDITTFGQQSMLGASIIDPGVLGQFLPGLQDGGQLLDQGLPFAFSDPNNFLTNRLFLLRRLQASLVLQGKKNSLVFRAYNFSRKAYTPDEEDESLIGIDNAFLTRNTTQTGGNVLLNHRLTALTSANFNFGYSRISFGMTDQDDDLYIFMLSLNKRITPNINGLLRYRHHRRSSNRSNADFSANAITASVRMNF